jgi:RNA polymerase sigma factor (sigma-70 family)
MLRILRPPNPGGLDQAPAELIAACAKNRGDSLLWTEFLRRYGDKIRQFIRGSLRMSMEGSSFLGDSVPAGAEEKDLFQSTILRLVEQDCAALKRFSGSTEGEWLAYLAIISRSVVRDALRRRNRLKRVGRVEVRERSAQDPAKTDKAAERPESSPIEREVLASEIRSLCEQQIHSDGPESCARNLLIFRLYFDHDLTARQIAACQGVNLSKTGVEKVINRLKERVRNTLSTDVSEAMMR